MLNAKSIQHEIENHGVSGDTVAEMHKRLVDYILPSAKAAPYTHAIVFGGTNDLAFTKTEEIFKTIQEIVSALDTIDCKYYIVNIPQPGWESKEKHPKYLENRLAVNALIKQHFPAELIDLDSKLPRLSMSEADQKLYFDDQLHYTAAGYDKLADIFFEAIFADAMSNGSH